MLLFPHRFFSVSIFHSDFQSAFNRKYLTKLFNIIYHLEALTKLYKMVYNDIQFNLIVTTEGTFKIRMENGNAEKTVWEIASSLLLVQ